MYTMEYSSTLKKERQPSIDNITMNLEERMLSERSQVQKDKHSVISLIRGSQKQDKHMEQ